MEPLNEQLVERIDRYIEDLFTPPDAVLEENLKDADACGLPPIQVSPNLGKLLHLLVKIAGAKRVLEIGTLGGYSTTWLARALPPDGVLITLECESKHAEVGRRNLKRAGLGGIVDIRVGAAADSLRDLIRAGVEPFGLIFIDADKASYVEYLNLSLELSRPGTVILADNVIRHGLVLDENASDATDLGARAYNQAIAHHPRLESLVLPTIRRRIDGLAISIVR
ncbi:MAG: O-methyltransferase [Bryobacteraceae bacterium]